jgi:hypothetical protein
MRLSLLLVLLLLLLVPAVLADETEPADPKAPVVREIKDVDLTPVKKQDENATTEKITNQKELKKLFTAKAAAQIAKKVDFTKDYLLAFFWAGSGGDKLSFKVEKTKDDKQALFTKTPGLTRDLRYHRKLFALKKGTTWKMSK